MNYYEEATNCTKKIKNFLTIVRRLSKIDI